jgi:hypothetical protein
MRIVFGKFHGHTLGEIAALEPTYLAWVERTITRDPDLVAAARVVLDRPARESATGGDLAGGGDPATGQDPASSASDMPGAAGTPGTAAGTPGTAAGNGNGDADRRPRQEATTGSAG